MSITVYVAAAMICIGGDCYPALVGDDTPIGQYTYYKTGVEDPLYGGSVAAFALDEGGAAYAIHQTWLGNPAERRDERIKSGDVTQRAITNGCINVDPMLYEALPDSADLTIRR